MKEKLFKLELKIVQIKFILLKLQAKILLLLLKKLESISRNQLIYPSICIHRQECCGCKKQSSKYEEIKYNSPGACNKYPKIPTYYLDKYFYYISTTDLKFKKYLVKFREAINMNALEVK